ncbi:MAG: ParA family protein [Rickettsiales bacterium]|jgi:chromosome partitioning protein|nr:ParA family protein [Rickettsiales bacterium]
MENIVSLNGARIISVANQKGGVGKTTTTINLATALVASGKKVLIVDFDSQGNLSTGFGIAQSMRNCTVYDVLMEPNKVHEAVLKTNIPNLDIITSNTSLSNADIQFSNHLNPAYCLKNALELVSNNYDYIFIDCPPALSFLTINALSASNSVLIPLQSEFFALEGIHNLVKTISKIKQEYNQELEIEGVVLTMYDSRNNISQQVENDVRECFKDKVFETVIPRNVRITEAPSHGKPVLLYDLNCAGSRSYISLASELLKKNKHQEVRKVA